MDVNFDESEWVLADAFEIPEGDWVVADGAEGSVSGVFFHRPRLSYAAFGRHSCTVTDPSLSFLPPSVSVRSSSAGLLLLRGPWSVYYVCNPATRQCRRIPHPPRPHAAASEPAFALVPRPDDPSWFHLVCAFEESAGAYRIETFSSASGKWRMTSAALSPADRIIPGSGVTAVGVAYWRTAAGGVIAFDPEADKTRVVPPPPGCAEAGGRWQLGQAGDRGLCCACVTGSEILVYRLSPSEVWAPIGSFGVKVIGDGKDGGGAAAARSERGGGDPIVCKEAPWPLRFESANLEVVLWVDGRLLAVDLESRWVREVRFEDGGPAPARDEEYVTHITTLTPVAPLGSA